MSGSPFIGISRKNGREYNEDSFIMEEIPLEVKSMPVVRKNNTILFFTLVCSLVFFYLYSNLNSQIISLLAFFGGIFSLFWAITTSRVASIVSTVNPIILVVADGMGGLSHSKEISTNAVNVVFSLIENHIEKFISSDEENNDKLKLLETVLLSTNDSVKSLASSKGWTPIGSTIALGIICNNRVFAGNLGDSLIFHYGNKTKKLMQVSTSHNVPGFLASLGKISNDEARRHHMMNYLDYFIGSDKIPEEDFSYSLEMDQGDRLIICTDGAVGQLMEKEIESIIMNEGNIEKCMDRILLSARESGESDNQTMLIYGI